jgi:hypothetical protein
MRISPLLPLILHTLLLLICFQNLVRNRHDGIVERGEREMPEIKFRRIVACLVMLMAALCTSGCEREMPDYGVFRKVVVW